MSRTARSPDGQLHAGLRPRRLAVAGLVLLAVSASILTLATQPPSTDVVLWSARLTGAAAYTAAGLTVASGMLVAWRGLTGHLSQRAVFRLHDRLAFAALGLTATHIAAVASLAFGDVGFGIFAPAAATFGVLATIGLVLAVASRWLTTRMEANRWRLLHRGTYVLFIAMLLHSGLAGPSIVEPHVRWLYVLFGIMLIGAAAFRVAFASHGGTNLEPRTRGKPGVELGVVLASEVARARLHGGEVLVVVIGGAGSDGGAPVIADALHAALARAIGGRSHGVYHEDGAVALVASGRVRTVSGALEGVDAFLLEHDLEGVAGAASFPADAWDAAGLLRLARMQSVARRFERLVRVA